MIDKFIGNKIKFGSILKWLIGLSVLGFLFYLPDVVGHSIVWIVHTFYEATSFLLEHFLMHTFGFDKPLAQLIIFYFSIVVGISTTVLFWKYYLRDYLVYKIYAFKYQMFYYWHSKRAIEKTKLILVFSMARLLCQ